MIGVSLSGERQREGWVSSWSPGFSRLQPGLQLETQPKKVAPLPPPQYTPNCCPPRSLLPRYRMYTRWLLLLTGLLGLSVAAEGADWPQWQGPDRNNISRETGLLKTWPKDGPKLLWTYTDAGVGYSAPAIVGDRLYIMGARQGKDQLFCLDVKAGKQLWTADI